MTPSPTIHDDDLKQQFGFPVFIGLFFFCLVCFRMGWWDANHYRSPCLPSEESDSEDAFEEGEDGLVVELDDMDPELNSIKYVMGDVTHPRAEEEDAIVVHCIGRTGKSKKPSWG